MKTMIIAFVLAAFVQGEQVKIEYVDYRQPQFEVVNAYYTDGEHITELKVVTKEEPEKTYVDSEYMSELSYNSEENSWN